MLAQYALLEWKQVVLFLALELEPSCRRHVYKDTAKGYYSH